MSDNIFGEGDQHANAVLRIMQLLRAKGARVRKDQRHNVNSDRVEAYFPDVTAEWPPIIVEINGPFGHRSKLSHANEVNQKKFFEEEKGSKFFTYAPTDLVGRGYVDSKGNLHKPLTDEDLYADWEL